MTLPTEREVRAMPAHERLERAEIVEVAYSEVCMHMQIAGQARPVVALDRGMVQILDPDGSLFSAPVTRGEVGLR